MRNWIDGMPNWFKAGAVVTGLLGLGATGGKVIDDLTGYAALVREVHLLRQDVKEQTCIQVAQLRKGNWTYCLVPDTDGGP